MTRQRDEILMKRYGINQADFDRMSDEQDGKCAVCLNPPTKRGLFVDHDHETGKVRGLLCAWCNTGLGHFKDSILYLFRAIAYLIIKRDKE